MTNLEMIVNVLDYGAIPDGNALNTKAVQSAIDSCAKQGGGRVVFSKGRYVLSTVFLKSNVEIVIEKDAVPNGEFVNVVPMPKAGGSLATCAYNSFEKPVVLEKIRADAGIDIGGTLIGMHLKDVAVPVRLEQKRIGEATIIAARTRCKFIGGERAFYDEKLSGGDIPR